MVMEEERSMEEGLVRKPLLKNQNDGEDCRMTSTVLLSTVVAVLGSFSGGCATSYTSAAQPGIMEDLGLSVAAFSAFGSFLTLGGIMGALFSGKMAGLFGRKGTMWAAQSLCAFGWLAIAFAQSGWWLNVGRISIGIGVGVISYVVPVYIAEITPKHNRGALTFSNQLLGNCGSAFVYFTGNFWNWRLLAILGALPCLAQIVGMFFIPESPRWLAKVGREKEIEISLRRFRGKDADISREADEIKVMTQISNDQSKSKFLDMFQRKYFRVLTVGIGLMLLQQLCGSSGVLYYASTIYRKADFSVAIGTSVLAVCMVPKAMLGLILIDNWGRRPLLMASTVGMFFSCCLLGVSFLLQDFGLLKELTPLFVFIGVMVYIGTFAIGLGGLPWIIMSEIFPIDIKVSAGSVVTLTNWIASWVITYTFNFMLEWSPPGTFFIFSAVCGAAFVFVCMLVPETSGLTLEEIQASLVPEIVTELN